MMKYTFLQLRLLRLRSIALLGIWSLMAATGMCRADASEEPFYHQFIDLRARADYHPTRTFTIIMDARHGNRLVAEDDPDLQFNIAWMDQFQPGYKSRSGGAAFGILVRSYLRTLVDSPDTLGLSNGLSPTSEDDLGVGFGGDTSYDLRLHSDEIRFGISHSF